jgi:hypothetical protein
MPISREAMDQLVNDHFMYEATADLEGVMGTYAEDPRHHVVGGPDGPLRGKPAIRGFYERLFPALKGERAENAMRVYGPDLIVDETILIGEVVDGRPFGLEGKRGKEVRVRLLHVFKIRDGLIADEKVWFDVDEMRRQLK